MTLDPQAQKLLELVEQSGIPPYETLTPEAARRLYDKACDSAKGDPPEPFAVRNREIPGPAGRLQVRCYHSTDAGNLPLVIFFHGGGFTIGSLDSHDAVCRQLCVDADCLVVSVAYRLAPEHRFPAALEDAYAASCWVAEHGEELGGDPQRLAVAGDSAGGNLAAVTCLLARENGFPDLCCQVLIYPGTDLTESMPSHQAFGEGYLLTGSLIDWFHGNYLGDFGEFGDLRGLRDRGNHGGDNPGNKSGQIPVNGTKTQPGITGTPGATSLPRETSGSEHHAADPAYWQASPLHADNHENLPPAHIITAGYDPLQDEGKAYADKLGAAGVSVSFRHYDNMMHGFITQPGYIDAAGDAIRSCAAQLQAAFNS